jgi:hypothetical protein
MKMAYPFLIFAVNTGRIKRDKPDALSVPVTINQVWSMDFISDSLRDGRSFRTFNLLDDEIVNV